VAWLAEGKSEDALSTNLEEAAKAAQEWADANTVAFDMAKTEAIVLSRRRRTALADARGIAVGGNTAYFNKQVTRWLGAWLDSQLALKEHHDVRDKRARNAQNRLRRLAGQVRELPTRPSRMCQSSSPLRIGRDRALPPAVACGRSNGRG